MTEWTPERLDSLPGGTVIDIELKHKYFTEPVRLVHDATGWWFVDDGDYISSVYLLELIGKPGLIRLVSVPIDALLSDDVLNCLPNPSHCWDIIRAAIAHVTGEES